jgi:hypothetical protein
MKGRTSSFNENDIDLIVRAMVKAALSGRVKA